MRRAHYGMRSRSVHIEGVRGSERGGGFTEKLTTTSNDPSLHQQRRKKKHQQSRAQQRQSPTEAEPRGDPRGRAQRQRAIPGKDRTLWSRRGRQDGNTDKEARRDNNHFYASRHPRAFMDWRLYSGLFVHTLSHLSFVPFFCYLMTTVHETTTRSLLYIFFSIPPVLAMPGSYARDRASVY